MYCRFYDFSVMQMTNMLPKISELFILSLTLQPSADYGLILEVS
jgi:hypothetical protein